SCRCGSEGGRAPSVQLTSLDLTDFRSYSRLTLPVRPGITVLVGQNGQGKTNVVEAVWYLATLSSHRVPHDAALVHRGESTAIVRASFVRAGRPLQVDLEITPGKSNPARLQGQDVPRVRDPPARASCAPAGRCRWISRSPRASPTGRGCRDRTCPGCVTCSARCAPCSSPPRIWA